MAGTPEDWDDAPVVFAAGAFAAQDGQVVPVSVGGVGGPVVGEAVLRAVADGVVAEMSFRLPEPIACSCGPKRRGSGRDQDCPVHGDQRRGGL